METQRTPHPRIKKAKGRWLVEYTRLWDSERNYLNPNYRQEVIAAIKFCEDYNMKEVRKNSNKYLLFSPSQNHYQVFRDLTT